MRIFAVIHDPIAEARCVVVAPAEPAVVENEALDSQARRRRRLRLEGFEVMGEIVAFPGIESDGPWSHGPARPGNDAAGRVVEPSAGLAKTAGGKRRVG